VSLRAGTALTLGITLALGGTVVAHADTVCASDECDGGAWQAGRGATNGTSYWGMGAGHNCTNYVAWKLSSAGVPRPASQQGNAADWAANAAKDGYLVDDVPSVGSVAQWDAFEGGSGFAGHVAYVEKINADGTILVSEDNWNSDGSGQLLFRLVRTASVSNFIHYGDTATWLRQATGGNGLWRERSTGIAAQPPALSAASMGGRSPVVAFVETDELMVAKFADGAWHNTATGLALRARSLSAVNMGGVSPLVVSLDGTRLLVSSEQADGWVSEYTGVEITGDIAAVNAGGPWPTILVSQGGTLYQVSNNGDGWFVTSTGLAASGPITAVSVGGTLIDAYSIEDGILYRLWSDGIWWHRDSTGVPAAGRLSAVGAEGASQVVLAEDGGLSLVYRDPLGWHKDALGLESGTAMTAVDMGGITPVVVQAG
jgi:surface antigen